MKVKVNLGGLLCFSEDDWFSIIVKNEKMITDYFMNIPVSQSSIMGGFGRFDLISSMNGDQYLLIYAENFQTTLTVNHIKWESIRNIIPCISKRINMLQRLKPTYENRINYFTKELHKENPQNLQDTRNLLEKKCDWNSIIDMEILSLGTICLFNK